MGKWTRTVDPQRGVQSFRTPTDVLAKWVEVQTFENPYVFVFEPTKTKVYQFEKKTCIPLMNVESKPFEFMLNKKAEFTDEKLGALVRADEPSMVYIWSPSMIYSMREMGTFIKVASEMNVKFVPVLDFNESVEESSKVLANYQTDVKLEKFRSLELYMREGTVHFPSTYIVGFNHISKRIFGVLTAEKLKDRVANEIANLKGKAE